jgi:hypothetical protein
MEDVVHFPRNFYKIRAKIPVYFIFPPFFDEFWKSKTVKPSVAAKNGGNI